MDATLRKEAARLRAMGSAQAATYLIENGRQSWRPTFILIQHLSWKVADQMRLAEHFLPKKPFADAFPYTVFASFMAADHFLAAIDHVWPDEKADRDLLEYHLGPILHEFEKTEKGKLAVQTFLSSRQ
ncbi:MAG: hypothetical protein WDM79_00765 [Terricaulis sp.]